MEYYSDDGYGAGVEGIFFVDDKPCPRCGSRYRRDNYSIQTGKKYIICAGCELRLIDLGSQRIFSKPYSMFGSSGLHDRGSDPLEGCIPL